MLINKKKLEKELIALTGKLISFETVTDNKKEIEKCFNFIKKQLKNFFIKEYIFNGKKSIAISLAKKKKKFNIILIGHLDVVPAEKKDFKPRTKSGKIYGRGSADMKAGVAISILILKNLRPKNVLLLLTSDEEIGGHNGTNYLAKKYKGDFVLSPEAGKGGITTKEKGVIWLKIKAKGKANHASTPWLGSNAIEKLISTYQEIKKMFPEIKAKDSFEKKWQKTINLGMIKGGSSAFNKIPDEAEAGIDIRYSEKSNPDKIIKIIKRVAKKNNCSVQIIEKEPMLLTKENRYLKLLKKISGIKEKSEFGSSDVRYFSNKGISAVDFSVTGGNWHAEDEYVNIKSMLKIYKVIEKFIQTLTN